MLDFTADDRMLEVVNSIKIQKSGALAGPDQIFCLGKWAAEGGGPYKRTIKR